MENLNNPVLPKSVSSFDELLGLFLGIKEERPEVEFMRYMEPLPFALDAGEINFSKGKEYAYTLDFLKARTFDEFASHLPTDIETGRFENAIYNHLAAGDIPPAILGMMETVRIVSRYTRKPGPNKGKTYRKKAA